MRHHQSTLRASTVYAHAQRLLQEHLELRDYKQAVPAGLLASVLLLAACWQASVSGVCHLVQDAPSHEVVRRALLACLPRRPRDLLGRVLAALRQTLPEHLRRCPHVCALDLHQRPYYGRPTRGVTRRQKKKSTRKSFTYATLAALTGTGRFTVGLLPTRPFMRLTTLLRELLRQAQEAGLSTSYLLLDKEFYSAEVVAWLQKRGVPFVMPALKRGGNKHLYESGTRVGWYGYSWEAPVRRWDFGAGKRRKKGTLVVEVKVCVAGHPKKAEPLVYACWGVGRWSPAEMVRTYRKRFGIEASYRQLGQCLGPTSTRDERVRLVLVGVALLWANLWAQLHSEVFSVGALGERRLQLPLLRLRQLLLAVAEVIATSLGGIVQEWPAQRPLPPELAHLGSLD